MEGKCTWFSFPLCKTAFHKHPPRSSVRGWASRCVCVGMAGRAAMPEDRKSVV